MGHTATILVIHVKGQNERKVFIEKQFARTGMPYHFIEDGTIRTNVLSPYIYARVAEKIGFIYKDIDQNLPGGIHIYPSETFAGNKHEVTPNSYAIHLCAHSWHMSPMEKIRKWLGISKRFKRQ